MAWDPKLAPCDNGRVNRWWFGLLLCATGCDVVFRIDKVRADAGPGAMDGVAADTAELPAFCPLPNIFDPFDLSTPICPWGTPDGSGQQIHDGVMDLPLAGTAATFIGCTGYRTMPFTSTGVFVVVPTVLAVPNAYTKLGVREAIGTTPTLDAQLVSDGTTLKVIVSGSPIAQASSTSYPWWRLSQPTPGIVRASVSQNGVTWVDLATTAIAAPAGINIDIGAGISATPSAAGTATFAAFGVCN